MILHDIGLRDYLCLQYVKEESTLYNGVLLVLLR